MSSSNKKSLNFTKNIDYISLLSVISAFAVVSLHTNGCFWEFSTKRYWFTANILECLWYFAVPVFFMISRSTLIDFRKRYNLRTYFWKRINKTVIPFIFWSLLGLVYKITIDHSIYIKDINLLSLWNGIVGSEYIVIYWFFISLFICYLCIPLFSAVPEGKRKDIFLYLIGLAFVCNSLAPFLIKIFCPALKWPFHIDVMGGFLIYILLGYILSRFDILSRYRYWIYIIGIIGLLAHIIGTYNLSIKAGEIIQTYKGYLNVPCILYSVAVFVFIKVHSDEVMAKVGGVVRWLKDYTFAVFLMHYFIINIFVRIFHIHTHSLVYRIFGAIVISIICIFIAAIIRKIPYGRKILP